MAHTHTQRKLRIHSHLQFRDPFIWMHHWYIILHTPPWCGYICSSFIHSQPVSQFSNLANEFFFLFILWLAENRFGMVVESFYSNGCRTLSIFECAVFQIETNIFCFRGLHVPRCRYCLSSISFRLFIHSHFQCTQAKKCVLIAFLSKSLAMTNRAFANKI